MQIREEDFLVQLVIAEKPSVAGSIAAALGVKEKKDGYIEGGGYLISWCVGHLVELAEAAAYGEQYKKWSYESLPILPEEWQYTVAADKGKQFKTLKELMHRADVSEVVNACDAGREGELIFRFVYGVAQCNKPMRRLWISSMENAAIKVGFADLKDGRDYDALYASALCRAKADWIIGINATRLFSCLYHKTLNVGRVQTPTLKMLVDRGEAISHFKKEKYYHARLDLSGAEAASERISDKPGADTLKAACEAETAVCVSLTKEKKTAAPPKLFDLTSLQREANKIYGYTAKQTLDLAQTLYEKRLLTYPRTDSAFLTDDMGETAAKTVTMLSGKLPFMEGAEFTPDVSRTLDSSKVSDHHAIIPTMELAKTDPAALPESERNILTLAGARLIFAAAEPHIFEAVTAVFSCAGTEFTARGKTVLAGGWKDLERRYRATLKGKPDPEDMEEENTLPELSEGQTFTSPTVKVTEHFTTPPKPHSEATLLSAMERAGNGDTDPDAERRGLGTPATRAAVIEKLVKSGFAERKGKQLIPTQNGAALVSVLPDMLTSPQLTAEWENNLTQIAKGAADAGEFMQRIEAMARELVKENATADKSKAAFTGGEEKPSIGKCPRCGCPVREGKKNYYCSNRDCTFTMWKNDRFFEERKVTFTPKIAAALLKSGKANVKGLYSPKTGKTYDGTVVLADTGGKYVNYKIELPKKK
ncbi:DNA topoisomerase III [Clostridiaceae bacterium]|nr:DNA topoisomerase III [Clostridiaceae bacterium]